MTRLADTPETLSPADRAPLSLLYPRGARQAPPSGVGLDEADLGLVIVVRTLDWDGRHSRFVSNVLAELNTDHATIAYRQDVLADLLALPALATAIGDVLPQLGELAGMGRSRSWGERVPLLEVAGRLAELDAYVSCVERLGDALERRTTTDERPLTNDQRPTTNDQRPTTTNQLPQFSILGSAGLLALRDRVAAARAEPDYRALAAELPALRAQIDRAGSVTVGINLNAQLRPESATVVSINAGRFAGKGTLLEKLLGERLAADAMRGITALYTADDGRPHTPEHELFRDLNRLLERVVQPVAAAVERYARLSSAWLVGLAPELAFYLGGVRLATELRAAGLALCRPSIAPAEERACAIEGLYSLELALRLRAARGDTSLAASIVPNDIFFGPGARIALMSGPNSGGKTTFTRAVGQAQALFQAGLLVPGSVARISPVDGIFTHFAAGERSELGRGRLAQELERLAQIFQRAGPYSLLLLNEPLSSTDHISARTLARELLAGLRLLGARALFVTHLYELIDDALAMEVAAEPLIVSLVAAAAPHDGNGAEPAPTFRIVRGRPQPPGYAAELARQYGLDATQIALMLRKRGLA
jgi:DNA mismatch repair protein MutS